MVTGVSQKRIVGLGALTLLALVFLPGLLTNEKKNKVPEQAAIPLKVAPAPVKAPVLPEVYTDRSLAHLDVNFTDEPEVPTVAALPEPIVEPAPATHAAEPGSTPQTAADIAEVIAPKSAVAASSDATAATTTVATTVAVAPKAEPKPIVKSDPKPAPKPEPKPEAPVLSPSTTPVTSVAALTTNAANSTATASSARWVIRLGSFNNAANVNALVARLKLGGYSVYTLPTVPVDGSLTRVMVGPDSNRSKLEQAQQALTRDFQLTGQIISYDPNVQ
ncbi:MAG: SPOR domain-containing protein [Ferrimonas sp.]